MSGDRLSLEMTISRADFLRLLPGAVAGPLVQTEDGFETGTAANGCSLRLTELPGLGFGHLSLERLRVDFAFRGSTRDQREAFLSRFRRQFQRGGG